MTYYVIVVQFGGNTPTFVDDKLCSSQEEFDARCIELDVQTTLNCFPPAYLVQHEITTLGTGE